MTNEEIATLARRFCSVASDPLQTAFERFLISREQVPLLAAIREHGGALSTGLDYPVVHLICDLQLCGTAFRIVRVADPDDHATRLYIYPTDSPSFMQPGIPFKLQGEAFWRLIGDKLRCSTEADDTVDWSMYDPSLRIDT